jgi:hypothetical protein
MPDTDNPDIDNPGADKPEITPRVIRAEAAAYGQAWRLAKTGQDSVGEDRRSRDHWGAYVDSDGADAGRDAGQGHIGTRLTLQADADARRAAETDAGWDRFVLLANLRNLELAGKVVVK